VPKNTVLYKMTLADYIKEINRGWGALSPSEQIKVSLRFMGKYLVMVSFFDEIEGQRWRMN